MPAFDLLSENLISPEICQIVKLAPMPGLDENPKSKPTCEAITAYFAKNGPGGTLVESALWLLAGELDRSHSVSQTIDTPDGSFWHGIMHRREGDFWNAKYWFRRVGRHSVMERLVDHIASHQDMFSASQLPTQGLLNASSAAATLVDLCEKAVASQCHWQAHLQQICWWEWQLLLEHACDQS